MSRKFASFVRFIENYNYYRRNGCNYKTAWHLAGITLT